MFDNDTLELIHSGPSLDGLDLSRLPQEFTAAFTSVVSDRIRLRGHLTEPVERNELLAIVRRMKRIASTNQAIALARHDGETRRSAAFISATAYQVCFISEKLLSDTIETRIRLDAISPVISSALLYIIAQSNADAIEMAKRIKPTGVGNERLLVSAIIRLIVGDFSHAIEYPEYIQDSEVETDLYWK
jgi:hypothetical protein